MTNDPAPDAARHDPGRPPAARMPAAVPLPAITIVACAMIIASAVAAAHRMSRVHAPSAAAAHASRERVRLWINPNTASAADLTLLPGIGPTRAGHVVAWRERRLRDDPRDKPFAAPRDLTDVRGIGPKTAAAIAPYLRFTDP